MPKKPRSLKQFIKEVPAPGVNKGCVICTLPECAELDEAMKLGLTTKAHALRWVQQECGRAEATRHKFDRHFEACGRKKTA